MDRRLTSGSIGARDPRPLEGVPSARLGRGRCARLPRAYLEPVAWGGAETGPAVLEAYVNTGLFPFPYARDLESSAELPNITAELLRRGYSELDVRKVLGLNWLRLFEMTWGG